VTTRPFSRSALSAADFVGWVPLDRLSGALDSIPRQAQGIYVLHRQRPRDPPIWITPSPVGMTWRGDPTVTIAQLEANWVPGANIVYIGKAKQRRMRKRLGEFLRFGEAREGRHEGGRLVWQLRGSWSLRVAWRILPDDVDALAVETKTIGAFRAIYGKPPFANRPHLWGR
jgi:hypothetical protein